MTNSQFYNLCTFGMVTLASYAYLAHRCLRNGTQLPLLYSDVSKLTIFSSALLTGAFVAILFS